MRALALGIAVSLLATAAPAFAQHGNGTKPKACATYSYSATSKAIGTWYLRQKDDAGNWSGPWTVVFNTNGTWSENGIIEGSWCQNGDTIWFGFSDSPHTMYRGVIGNKTIQGIESWDELGTGTFELYR